MKKSAVRLASLDAEDVAVHLAAILTSQRPAPQTALLIAEDSRPMRRILQRLFPDTRWQCVEVPAHGSLNFGTIPDSGFDAVVLLDVIATVPVDERLSLVRECVRIARRDALVAAPLGTDLQKSIEESLAKYHRELLGKDHPWIAVHLKHGLPVPEEALSWTEPSWVSDLFFAGDVTVYREAAERAIRAAASGPMTRLLAHFNKYLLFETGRLELESVPMRRHRRLYLHLRRA
jgi:hypothetical protein